MAPVWCGATSIFPRYRKGTVAFFLPQGGSWVRSAIPKGVYCISNWGRIAPIPAILGSLFSPCYWGPWARCYLHEALCRPVETAIYQAEIPVWDLKHICTPYLVPHHREGVTSDSNRVARVSSFLSLHPTCCIQIPHFFPRIGPRGHRDPNG